MSDDRPLGMSQKPKNQQSAGGKTRENKAPQEKAPANGNGHENPANSQEAVRQKLQESGLQQEQAPRADRAPTMGQRQQRSDRKGSKGSENHSHVDVDPEKAYQEFMDDFWQTGHMLGPLSAKATGKPKIIQPAQPSSPATGQAELTRTGKDRSQATKATGMKQERGDVITSRDSRRKPNGNGHDNRNDGRPLTMSDRRHGNRNDDKPLTASEQHSTQIGIDMLLAAMPKLSQLQSRVRDLILDHNTRVESAKQVSNVVSGAAGDIAKIDQTKNTSIFSDAAIVFGATKELLKLGPSGTLVFRAGGTLHQAKVINGLVRSDDGKTIGSLNANGLVTFNEQSKFGLGSTLNIKNTPGAFFHSNNSDHKDIAYSSDNAIATNNPVSSDDDSINLFGEFGPEGDQDKQKAKAKDGKPGDKPHYIVTAGNVFDDAGNFYGHLTRTNREQHTGGWALELPAERPANNLIGPSQDGSQGYSNDNWTLNRLFNGLTFNGTERSKDGVERPWSFKVDSKLASGDALIQGGLESALTQYNPDAPPVRYEITNNILTGADNKIYGITHMPSLNPDDHEYSTDAYIAVLTSSDGKTLRAAETKEDLEKLRRGHPDEVKKIPLASLTKSIFNWKYAGDTGLEALPSSVMCMGNKRSADGTFATEPDKQGFVDIAKLKVMLTKQSTHAGETKLSLDDQAAVRAKCQTRIDYLNQLIKEGSVKVEFGSAEHEHYSSVGINPFNLESLQRDVFSNSLNKDNTGDELTYQKRLLDSARHQLEQLPEDLSKIHSGHITRKDKDGKVIERDIIDGKLYEPGSSITPKEELIRTENGELSIRELLLGTEPLDAITKITDMPTAALELNFIGKDPNAGRYSDTTGAVHAQWMVSQGAVSSMAYLEKAIEPEYENAVRLANHTGDEEQKKNLKDLRDRCNTYKALLPDVFKAFRDGVANDSHGKFLAAGPAKFDPAQASAIQAAASSTGIAGSGKSSTPKELAVHETMARLSNPEPLTESAAIRKELDRWHDEMVPLPVDPSKIEGGAITFPYKDKAGKQIQRILAHGKLYDIEFDFLDLKKIADPNSYTKQSGELIRLSDGTLAIKDTATGGKTVPLNSIPNLFCDFEFAGVNGQPIKVERLFRPDGKEIDKDTLLKKVRKEHAYAEAIDKENNGTQKQVFYEASARFSTYEQTIENIFRRGSIETAEERHILETDASKFIRPKNLQDAPSRMQLPKLNAVTIPLVNGNLRLDNQFYEVKKGLLYKITDGVTESAPCGQLLPNYQVTLANNGKFRPPDASISNDPNNPSSGENQNLTYRNLHNENHVLFNFSISAEEFANASEGNKYRVFSTGANTRLVSSSGNYSPEGEYITGGLVEAHEFEREAREHLDEAKSATDRYSEVTFSTKAFGDRLMTSGGLTRVVQESVDYPKQLIEKFLGLDSKKFDSGILTRQELLDYLVHSIDTNLKGLDIDRLFKDGLANKIDNNKISEMIAHAGMIKMITGIEAADTRTLAADGEHLQELINSSASSGAVLIAGMMTGAAMAFIARGAPTLLATSGRAATWLNKARQTIAPIAQARGVNTGVSASMGGLVSAGMRRRTNGTIEEDIRHFGQGFLEVVALKVGGGSGTAAKAAEGAGGAAAEAAAEAAAKAAAAEAAAEIPSLSSSLIGMAATGFRETEPILEFGRALSQLPGAKTAITFGRALAQASVNNAAGVVGAAQPIEELWNWQSIAMGAANEAVGTKLAGAYFGKLRSLGWVGENMATKMVEEGTEEALSNIFDPDTMQQVAARLKREKGNNFTFDDLIVGIAEQAAWSAWSSFGVGGVSGHMEHMGKKNAHHQQKELIAKFKEGELEAYSQYLRTIKEARAENKARQTKTADPDTDHHNIDDILAKYPTPALDTNGKPKKRFYVAVTSDGPGLQRFGSLDEADSNKLQDLLNNLNTDSKNRRQTITELMELAKKGDIHLSVFADTPEGREHLAHASSKQDNLMPFVVDISESDMSRVTQKNGLAFIPYEMALQQQLEPDPAIVQLVEAAQKDKDVLSKYPGLVERRKAQSQFAEYRQKALDLIQQENPAAKIDKDRFDDPQYMRVKLRNSTPVARQIYQQYQDQLTSLDPRINWRGREQEITAILKPKLDALEATLNSAIPGTRVKLKISDSTGEPHKPYYSYELGTILIHPDNLAGNEMDLVMALVQAKEHHYQHLMLIALHRQQVLDKARETGKQLTTEQEVVAMQALHKDLFNHEAPKELLESVIKDKKQLSSQELAAAKRLESSHRRLQADLPSLEQPQKDYHIISELTRLLHSKGAEELFNIIDSSLKVIPWQQFALALYNLPASEAEQALTDLRNTIAAKTAEAPRLARQIAIKHWQERLTQRAQELVEQQTTAQSKYHNYHHQKLVRQVMRTVNESAQRYMQDQQDQQELSNNTDSQPVTEPPIAAPDTTSAIASVTPIIKDATDRLNIVKMQQARLREYHSALEAKKRAGTAQQNDDGALSQAQALMAQLPSPPAGTHRFYVSTESAIDQFASLKKDEVTRVNELLHTINNGEAAALAELELTTLADRGQLKMHAVDATAKEHTLSDWSDNSPPIWVDIREEDLKDIVQVNGLVFLPAALVIKQQLEDIQKQQQAARTRPAARTTLPNADPQRPRTNTNISTVTSATSSVRESQDAQKPAPGDSQADTVAASPQPSPIIQNNNRSNQAADIETRSDNLAANKHTLDLRYQYFRAAYLRIQDTLGALDNGNVDRAIKLVVASALWPPVQRNLSRSVRERIESKHARNQQNPERNHSKKISVKEQELIDSLKNALLIELGVSRAEGQDAYNRLKELKEVQVPPWALPPAQTGTQQSVQTGQQPTTTSGAASNIRIASGAAAPTTSTPRKQKFGKKKVRSTDQERESRGKSIRPKREPQIVRIEDVVNFNDYFNDPNLGIEEVDPRSSKPRQSRRRRSSLRLHNPEQRISRKSGAVIETRRAAMSSQEQPKDDAELHIVPNQHETLPPTVVAEGLPAKSAVTLTAQYITGLTEDQFSQISKDQLRIICNSPQLLAAITPQQFDALIASNRLPDLVNEDQFFALITPGRLISVSPKALVDSARSDPLQLQLILSREGYVLSAEQREALRTANLLDDIVVSPRHEEKIQEDLAPALTLEQRPWWQSLTEVPEPVDPQNVLDGLEATALSYQGFSHSSKDTIEKLIRHNPPDLHARLKRICIAAKNERNRNYALMRLIQRQPADAVAFLETKPALDAWIAGNIDTQKIVSTLWKSAANDKQLFELLNGLIKSPKNPSNLKADLCQAILQAGNTQRKSNDYQLRITAYALRYLLGQHPNRDIPEIKGLLNKLSKSEYRELAAKAEAKLQQQLESEPSKFETELSPAGDLSRDRAVEQTKVEPTTIADTMLGQQSFRLSVIGEISDRIDWQLVDELTRIHDESNQINDYLTDLFMSVFQEKLNEHGMQLPEFMKSIKIAVSQHTQRSWQEPSYGSRLQGKPNRWTLFNWFRYSPILIGRSDEGYIISDGWEFQVNEKPPNIILASDNLKEDSIKSGLYAIYFDLARLSQLQHIDINQIVQTGSLSELIDRLRSQDKAEVKIFNQIVADDNKYADRVKKAAEQEAKSAIKTHVPCRTIYDAFKVGLTEAVQQHPTLLREELPTTHGQRHYDVKWIKSGRGMSVLQLLMSEGQRRLSFALPKDLLLALVIDAVNDPSNIRHHNVLVDLRNLLQPGTQASYPRAQYHNVGGKYKGGLRVRIAESEAMCELMLYIARFTLQRHIAGNFAGVGIGKIADAIKDWEDQGKKDLIAKEPDDSSSKRSKQPSEHKTPPLTEGFYRTLRQLQQKGRIRPLLEHAINAPTRKSAQDAVKAAFKALQARGESLSDQEKKERTILVAVARSDSYAAMEALRKLKDKSTAQYKAIFEEIMRNRLNNGEIAGLVRQGKVTVDEIQLVIELANDDQIHALLEASKTNGSVEIEQKIYESLVHSSKGKPMYPHISKQLRQEASMYLLLQRRQQKKEESDSVADGGKDMEGEPPKPNIVKMSGKPGNKRERNDKERPLIRVEPAQARDSTKKPGLTRAKGTHDVVGIKDVVLGDERLGIEKVGPHSSNRPQSRHHGDSLPVHPSDQIVSQKPGEVEIRRAAMSSQQQPPEGTEVPLTQLDQTAKDVSLGSPPYEAPAEMDWVKGTPPEWVAQCIADVVYDLCESNLAAKVVELRQLRKDLEMKAMETSSIISDQLSKAKRTKKVRSRDSEAKSDEGIDAEDLDKPQLLQEKLKGRKKLEQLYARYRHEITPKQTRVSLLEKETHAAELSLTQTLNQAVCGNVNQYPAQSIKFDLQKLLWEKSLARSLPEGELSVLRPEIMRPGQASKVIDAITHENKHQEQKILKLAYLLQEYGQDLQDVIDRFKRCNYGAPPTQSLMDYALNRKALTQREKDEGNRLYEKDIQWQEISESFERAGQKVSDLTKQIKNLQDNPLHLSMTLHNISLGGTTVTRLFGTSGMPPKLQKLMQERAVIKASETRRQWDKAHEANLKKLIVDAVQLNLDLAKQEYQSLSIRYKESAAEVDTWEAGGRAGQAADMLLAPKQALKLIDELIATPARNVIKRGRLVMAIGLLIKRNTIPYVLNVLDTGANKSQKQRNRELKKAILATIEREEPLPPTVSGFIIPPGDGMGPRKNIGPIDADGHTADMTEALRQKSGKDQDEVMSADNFAREVAKELEKPPQQRDVDRLVELTIAAPDRGSALHAYDAALDTLTQLGQESTETEQAILVRIADSNSYFAFDAMQLIEDDTVTRRILERRLAQEDIGELVRENKIPDHMVWAMRFMNDNNIRQLLEASSARPRLRWDICEALITQGHKGDWLRPQFSPELRLEALALIVQNNPAEFKDYLAILAKNPDQAFANLASKGLAALTKTYTRQLDETTTIEVATDGEHLKYTVNGETYNLTAEPWWHYTKKAPADYDVPIKIHVFIDPTKPTDLARVQAILIPWLIKQGVVWKTADPAYALGAEMHPGIAKIMTLEQHAKGFAINCTDADTTIKLRAELDQLLADNNCSLPSKPTAQLDEIMGESNRVGIVRDTFTPYVAPGYRLGFKLDTVLADCLEREFAKIFDIVPGTRFSDEQLRRIEIACGLQSNTLAYGSPLANRKDRSGLMVVMGDWDTARASKRDRMRREHAVGYTAEAFAGRVFGKLSDRQALYSLAQRYGIAQCDLACGSIQIDTSLAPGQEVPIGRKHQIIKRTRQYKNIDTKDIAKIGKDKNGKWYVIARRKKFPTTIQLAGAEQQTLKPNQKEYFDPATTKISVCGQLIAFISVSRPEGFNGELPPLLLQRPDGSQRNEQTRPHQKSGSGSAKEVLASEQKAPTGKEGIVEQRKVRMSGARRADDTEQPLRPVRLTMISSDGSAVRRASKAHLKAVIGSRKTVNHAFERFRKKYSELIKQVEETERAPSRKEQPDFYKELDALIDNVILPYAKKIRH